MEASEEDWDRWITGLRQGDERIVFEFCQRYGPSLERIAAGHMYGRLRRRIDPEDVVQSALRTFLRRAHGGQFKLDDSENLWRLLCAITLTKVREQARFQMRHRRGLDREETGAGRTGGALFNAPDPAPSPAELAEFADSFESLLESLDGEERRIVDLKLQDLRNEEVADRLGCSDRTVRRILSRIQANLT